MSWIEDQLRKSLGRLEPPEGFAGRVMERIERGLSGSTPPAKVVDWRPPVRRGPWYRFAAIAACVILIVAGGLFQARRERRARERAEAEQAFAALQLTAGKLHSVRARIANVRLLKKIGRQTDGVEEE